MKRIYLIRHGKAEEGYGKSDFERDLAPKGHKKTKKIAEFLRDKGVKPQQMLVSSANRTTQTAEILAQTLGLEEENIQYERALYLASPDSMLDVVFSVNDAVDELMIVAHNPGISDLASYLAKKDMGWMLTSAVVAVDIKVDKWIDIPQAKSKFIFHTKPADL